MSNTTVSLKNVGRPAPRWFRKLKKAIGIIVLTANVMVAQWPTGNELLKTMIQLWCTVGIGGILEELEAVLANGEYYTEQQSDDAKPA